MKKLSVLFMTMCTLFILGACSQNEEELTPANKKSELC